MNTFTNDGSFMEQFLKKQKVTHDTTGDASDNKDADQQQQQMGYDYSAYYAAQGYDESTAAYYQDPAYAAYYAQYQQAAVQQQAENPDFNQYSHEQSGANAQNAYQMGGGGGGGPMGGNKTNSSQPSRVIWAGNTHPDATEEEIRHMFGTFGYIKYVKLVPAKRYSFITYAELSSAIQAQYELNGAMLRGLPLKLGFGKTEAKETTTFDTQNPPCKNLWIGNVATSVTEDNLRELCEGFGKVDYVRVLTGRQCAFVSFQDIETAILAKSSVQGRNFHGLNLAVNFRRESDGDFNKKDRFDRFGGERGGDRGDRGERSADNRFGGDRGDRGGDRFGDRGGDRGGDRSGDRGGDRGGFRERFNNRGGGAASASAGNEFYEQSRDHNGNPLPAAPPASAGLQTIIDKLATYVAKNGPRFESYTQEKQRNNPQFDFLRTNHQNHDYYRWKLWTIKNPDVHAADRDTNQINQFVPPTQQEQQQQQQQLQQQQQQQPQNETTQFNPPQQQSYLNEQQVQEFKDMLEKLNLSKGSITSCKTWIMSHIQHALEVISIITTTHQQGILKFSQKLNILYVLNDSLHNCLGRRRGEQLDEFADAIKDYLPFIIASTSAGESPDNQEKVVKVLNIWENQKIYPKQMIEDLKMAATDEQSPFDQ